MIRRVLALAAGTGVLLLATPAGVAQAHPLGNFTVNHYADVQLSPDRVDVTAVVDRAEIPAAQALQEIAPDGSATPDQLAAAAAPECAALADALTVTVDGERLGWSVDSTALESIPGAAGLPTLRLTCALSADADLSSAATVTVEDDYLTDRVGWREMTADGDGVRLLDAPVPVESITDQLREYPVDLLASPVDVRGFTVRTEPGTNTGAGTSITPGSGDPFSNALAAVDRRLEDLIGGNSLTPLVGTLAILLAVLLGCGHALLPGHGKTVMAAYLAGRDGRPRDALVVGATVTATHTVGVLALGLAISVSSSLAGDQVLRWLGVISGLLVAAIGAAMLRGALPRWRAARRHPAAAATLPAAALPEPALAVGVSAAAAHVHASPHHAHAPAHDHDHLHEHDHLHDHEHGHDHPHDHEHGHDHPHDHEHGHDHPHDHDHDHEHEHDHAHGADHEHAHEEEHQHAAGGWWSGGHSHGPGGHSHGPGGHSHGPGGHSHGPGGHGHGRPIGRGGLIGMGVAAALVPSPSALIVLIASIGLGRTVFGVVLVLAYGLGMAGTLTAVGLLLVRLRGRLARRVAGLRRERPLYRLATAMPVVTAVLVLLVGTSLVLRGVLLG